MEGLAKRATREVDLATVNAWNTAMFALGGYSGKLKGKSVADFLSNAPKTRREISVLAMARELEAKGKFVKIKRVVH